MWQFVGNTLKFGDTKPPNVLKDKIDSLIGVCVQNESNKHLRLQCLVGICYLLQFDKLIDQAAKPLSAAESNCEFLSKLIWHSLWNENSLSSADNATSEEERWILTCHY